ELYTQLPAKGKNIMYKKIQKIQLEIDRKESIMLAKEFLTAVKGGRKEDSKLIYVKLKRIYPRIPQKDRDKIFDKIKPYISSLNS
ncbi:MAG TPA: hypothetical protein V6C58_07550, partial [Allocoleopsis sp.]